RRGVPALRLLDPPRDGARRRAQQQRPHRELHRPRLGEAARVDGGRLMGKDLERDVFKILGLGIIAVVAVKLVENAGGVAQITKALVGGYTDTLGTISKT